MDQVVFFVEWLECGSRTRRGVDGAPDPASIVERTIVISHDRWCLVCAALDGHRMKYLYSAQKRHVGEELHKEILNFDIF